MRCEVNVDANNIIRNAVSTGTMWRGLEVILKGRDPRDAWAFTQRICGVCTGTHALTSVRAVEDALEDQDPGERQLDPQHHAALAADARPSRALLPPARARLGQSGERAEGRSEGDQRAAEEAISPQPSEVLARLFPRRAEPPEEVRRERPARAVQERLLGQSGLSAAARSQPDGDDALSRGARLPDRRS